MKELFYYSHQAEENKVWIYDPSLENIEKNMDFLFQYLQLYQKQNENLLKQTWKGFCKREI